MASMQTKNFKLYCKFSLDLLVLKMVVEDNSQLLCQIVAHICKFIYCCIIFVCVEAAD